jgi:pyruvate dehydrogenase E2 component (dihydrolipoamide acetyltransferase)
MAHAKASANPNDFILPDLGEGVHEAELINWRVQPGQTVEEHEILAEMETDKALVEVPSPRAGIIAKLHGKPGEILRVGNPLVTYEGGDGGEEAQAAAPARGSKTEASAEATPNGSAAAHNTPDEGERQDAGTVVGIMNSEAGKVLATPAVRRLARDLGVDINGVGGSGIGGRVTEKDVRAASEGGAQSPAAGRDAARAAARSGRAGVPGEPATVVPFDPETPRAELAVAPVGRGSAPAPRPAPSFPAGQEVQRIPFRGVRRTIANRLRESINQAVHFNVMDEADVSALDNLRRKLAAASGEKVSFLPFVASAICRVLTDPRFRAMNATVDEKPGDANYEASIVQHRGVHLGIAADTDTGLMVPVIRDADGLGVLELGRHIAHVASAARDRSIGREQLTGSTFTISNVGSHAGRFATPIINYPEVAILGVGRARQVPVIRSTSGGPAFAIGNMLPLSLACDHRVVDGATAALALARIIELLQDAEQLLTPARR